MQKPQKKWYSHKHDIVKGDYEMLHPNMLMVWGIVVGYCDQHQLPLRVTSLISDRAHVQSISKTHEDGRAVDISIKGWSQFEIERFVHKFNGDYSKFGAYSYSDGLQRVAIYGDDKHLDHIHLQVQRDYVSP